MQHQKELITSFEQRLPENASASQASKQPGGVKLGTRHIWHSSEVFGWHVLAHPSARLELQAWADIQAPSLHWLSTLRPTGLSRALPSCNRHAHERCIKQRNFLGCSPVQFCTRFRVQAHDSTATTESCPDASFRVQRHAVWNPPFLVHSQGLQLPAVQPYAYCYTCLGFKVLSFEASYNQLEVVCVNMIQAAVIWSSKWLPQQSICKPLDQELCPQPSSLVFESHT